MPSSAKVSNASDLILGLHVAASSVGWSLLMSGQDGMPTDLVRAGVRVFEPGASGDIGKGLEISNAVERRSARHLRRQFRRAAARRSQLFDLLQIRGLLPPSLNSADPSSERHLVLNRLDNELSAKWRRRSGGFSTLPLYVMRKAALDEALEPFEIGRILYHLCQHRGYASNRKRNTSQDDSPNETSSQEAAGVVQQDIDLLFQAMRETGARTLGEYFATVDPHRDRVRRRWTSRAMYEDEFALIWEHQQGFRPELLMSDLRQLIKTLLFSQRPVNCHAHRIGTCALEPAQRRASWATLEAQRFRILRKLNDLEIMLPGRSTGIPLTAEQRKIALTHLESSPEVSFKTLRAALGLAKKTGFNLQRGGESSLNGDAVNAVMARAFGDRWLELPSADKLRVVEEWHHIERHESFVRRAMDYWQLSRESAEWLASQPVPKGYCPLSRRAIRKLLPSMEAGCQFKDAQSQLYGHETAHRVPQDRLPPLRDVLPGFFYPIIERSLSELRKVVNSLIAEYGKPKEIHIELAPELKRSRQERQRALEVKRSREKEREAVRKRITDEFGPGFRVSWEDVEKGLLFQECDGVCPFTGKQIPFSRLFGSSSMWKVVPIIPLHYFPDDSLQNKVLCYADEAYKKFSQTPFEAFPYPAQYEAICDRVAGWKKPNPGKLRRFRIKSLKEIQSISHRHFRDDRQEAQIAARFLATLYGGGDIPTNEGPWQTIFAHSGTITATLRRHWGLESILREQASSDASSTKRGNPTDHRRHAIDALAVGFCQPKLIARLSGAKRDDDSNSSRADSSARIRTPWKNFLQSVRPIFEHMIVCHRLEHRLTGPLHDETNYSRPRSSGGKEVVHIRKPVLGLSAKEIECIVDPAVREAVRSRASEHGGDFKHWDPNHGHGWPLLVTRTGKAVPIKRVRLRRTLAVETIGTGMRTRHVVTKGNHHFTVFALLDECGRERRWDFDVVSLFEAATRKRLGQSVVRTEQSSGENARFKFHAMWGDILKLHLNCNHDQLICAPSFWKVRSIWEQKTLTLVEVNDGRPLAEIRAAKDLLLASPECLRKAGATKVWIDSLGRVQPDRSLAPQALPQRRSA
jgi:CRISPR-associated endonuclease Csn1